MPKKQIEVVNLEDEKEEEEEDYIAARKALDNDIKTAEDKIEENKTAEVKIEEDITPVVNTPVKKPDEKTQCPDCGKLVSKKTLRYTHKYQCSAKTQQHTPIKEAPQIKETTPKELLSHALRGETTPIISEVVPTKPTITQTPYFSRPRPQRYEHIKLF